MLELRSAASPGPLGAARDREHGQILVLFAFVLVALLLISALAVDYGGWLLARRSYQNISDEAALAGSYQLTNPTGADCPVGAGISKQTCARKAAWESIQAHIGSLPTGFDLDALSLESGVAHQWDGWTVSVASPPSDDPTYPGFASSNKTIYVHVEKSLEAGLSRMIQGSKTIGAWATAGRIPENFAIVLLCQTGCLGGGADGQVAGTGSNLILESGDLGSNSWVKTSGNSASLALCEGSAFTSQCSAYMHTASQCTTTSSVCQIDRWDGTNVDTSTRYSALALPQVIDPAYTLPTLSDTRSGGVVSGTAPFQCYATTDFVPAVAAVPSSQEFAKDVPLMLTAAQLPPTPGPVTLGSSTMSGQVTDSVSGSPLNGATVTVVGPNGSGTPTTYTATTSGSGGNAGKWSIPGVTPAGTYTMTVSLANYGTQTFNIDVSANGPTPRDVALVPNPGTITGTISGTVASSFTITTSNGASTTITATGPYTISNVTSGTNIVVTPNPPSGYQATPTTRTITLTAGGTTANVDFSIGAIPTGTITGTVTDETTGLGLVGATVTATGGGNTKTATTDATGAYTILNVPIGSPATHYTVTATKTAWKDYSNDSTQNNVTVSATGIDLKLWPSNCGTTGGGKGSWDCDNGTGCRTVTDPTGIGVGCSAYDNTNRIRPGTYKNITIGNNECAWIDPLGGAQGLTSGQDGGVVYVTDTISIGSNAFLLGDGVTIVLGAGAHADVGNAGGFVINYGGANCDPVPGTPTSCSWRTANYIGNETGTPTWSYCGTDTDLFADLRHGAFTTGGDAHVARLTWDTSGTPCYQDGSTGTYLTTYKGEIGMAFYLRDNPTCCGGHRFAFSGQMGFLFDGVLYGPNDDIDLGGQGAQAAAGQIVAYTLKYHGDTDIHQRYSGIEIDGPPYLIEPYIGE